MFKLFDYEFAFVNRPLLPSVIALFDFNSRSISCLTLSPPIFSSPEAYEPSESAFASSNAFYFISNLAFKWCFSKDVFTC